MRQIFILFGFLFSCISAYAQTYDWKSVNLQGMGYVTGMVIHPKIEQATNLIYARTDVGGAYRFIPAEEKWLPLLDFASFKLRGNLHVESMAIDNLDPMVVYAAVDGTDGAGGEILKSVDQGANWSTTGLSSKSVYIAGNDPYRGSSGERLMVDPNNSGILYFGSREDGLWRKIDAGSWTKVDGGLPSDPANPGFTFVLFDESTLAGGKTQTIFAGCYGSGVWKTEDAGETWTNLEGGTNCMRASLSSDGTLYISYGGHEQSYSGPGKVAKYKNGVWSTITPPSGPSVSYSGICVDPTNPLTVVVTTNQRIMYYTTNGGTNWVRINSKFSYYPAYYNAGVNSFNWGTAALIIDPNNTSRLWSTNGYGVIKTDDYKVTTSTWEAVMNNLEEICLMQIITPPLVGGADLLSITMDMVGFRHYSRDMVPSGKIAKFPYVSMGVSMDYCFSNPNHIVFIALDQTNNDSYRGYSTDNGLTWTSFSGTPGKGGKIAVSATNEKNWVWTPDGETTAPQYTLDAGKTWAPCQGITGPWHQSTWGIMSYLAADKVNGNKFYYNNNGKMFYSQDGGANWAAGYSSLPGWPHGIFLKTHPYHEGELWTTVVPSSGQSSRKIYISKDGGKTFSMLNTVAYAYNIAFGKGDTDQVPYVYMSGKVGTQPEGIYKSTDEGKTWTLISDPTRLQFTENVEADMRYKDLVYSGGAGCRGIFYGFPEGETVDVKEPTGMMDIQIIPNPVNDRLQVVSSTTIKSITILDLSGRELLNSKPETDFFSINSSFLQDGWYLLICETDTSRKTIRFLKQ